MDIRKIYIGAMVPDLPVLRMAYLIERDFAEFYEMATGKTEGEEREVQKCWRSGSTVT
jgi:hypothetical protein